jgi:hypothetical protein
MIQLQVLCTALPQKPIGLAQIGQRAPMIGVRLERGDCRFLGQIVETTVTALAARIFEIKRLAAVLTFKNTHSLRKKPFANSRM